MKTFKTANYEKGMKKKALLQLGTMLILVDQVVEMVTEWGDDIDAAMAEVFEGQNFSPDVMQMAREEVEQKIMQKGTNPGDSVDTTPLDSDTDFTERGF
jgi:hypothetical protein